MTVRKGWKKYDPEDKGLTKAYIAKVKKAIEKMSPMYFETLEDLAYMLEVKNDSRLKWTIARLFRYDIIWVGHVQELGCFELMITPF